MEALMGGSVVPDLLGVVVGHLYYFLTVLHPRAGGPRLIRTPAFVRQLCVTVVGVYSPARPPVRAFGGGRGRRLGSE